MRYSRNRTRALSARVDVRGSGRRQNPGGQGHARELPTIASKVEKLQKIDGYMPLYWQASAGKLFMEIGAVQPGAALSGLAAGGPRLEPGRPRSRPARRLQRRHLRAHRTEGPDDAAELRYRAISSNEAERRAVKESFAQSVLWGFKVEAEEGDRVLVDATAFFMRDAHGVVDRLRQASRAVTSSTTAAARSTCRAQRGSRRTPRSRRR